LRFPLQLLVIPLIVKWKAQAFEGVTRKKSGAALPIEGRPRPRLPPWIGAALEAVVSNAQVAK